MPRPMLNKPQNQDNKTDVLSLTNTKQQSTQHIDTFKLD